MLFLLLIVLILLLFYFLVKRYFLYFEKLGFPNVPGTFPFGSIFGVGINEHLCEFTKRNYEQFKNKSPAFGFYIFYNPVIVPTDPELVKEILLKTFESFNDHGLFVNENDSLTNNIFFAKGQQWKDLRAKLSPTFTSARMKMMFPIVESKADRMIEFLNSKSVVEMKEVFSSFTTESIVSVAFGLEVNSYDNPNEPFKKAVQAVVNPSLVQNIKNILVLTSERIAKFLNLTVNTKETIDFFMNTVRETLEYRERNKVERNDFFQLIMNVMKNEGLSFEEMVANCFLFFLAGFETSSSVSTFMVYELALNQDIQERLRDEINEVLERHNGEVTYDAIMDMKYLDMVFNETLRKWPVLDSQIRRCEKDFKIPNSDLMIRKGTLLLIPAIGLHLDERYWDEPEKFNPERFNEENVKKIVPFSYIPFSEGPRTCIGLRFGTMQTKLGIVKLLQNFKLSTSNKNIEPFEFSPTGAFQSRKGGMWLKIEKV